MTRDMRLKNLWYGVLPALVVAILIVLMSQRAADPETATPIPDLKVNRSGAEHETQGHSYDLLNPVNDRASNATRGPLQERIASTFPGPFKRGVDIFWEPADGWVSTEVFDWWVTHLEYRDIEGLTPEAAERMFSRITDDSSVFPRPEKRRICAVVGASRNLIGSGYGDLIDAHDLVFRVNRAPTDPFRSDVGGRTTHHVMWPRDLDEWQYDRDAYLLMTPVTASNRDVFDRILYLVDEDFNWDPLRVRIIHPEFVKYVHENWTEGRMAYPSTGFITLMIALNVCDEVDVFGFGADASGRWDRYYEDVPEDVSQFHPANIEAQRMREMEDNGIVRIFRGNRLDPGAHTDASNQH